MYEVLGNYLWNGCNMWLVMLNYCDLGCMQVGLKSFVASVDYQVYMGSSMTVWSLRSLLSYLCSYKLVSSVTTSTTSISGWKWKEVSMDFIVGLPPTDKNFDSIWMIVDRLTKSAHFILVRTDYRPHEYAELYFSRIVRLNGVPRTIVSDRGPQFTTRF